ncbi:MAG: GAF domain-containing protein [Rikenellaceae bacterium]
MAESVYIPENGSKADIYEALVPQISALTKYETDQISSLANVVAVLKEAFDFFWVGFYKVGGDEKLHLHAFQGPLACTRISYGKGVCGTAWKEQKTVLVEDVEKFEGHIACSSASKSEVVVPLIKDGRVVAVLDVDSDKIADFDECDALYLEKICTIVAENSF